MCTYTCEPKYARIREEGHRSSWFCAACMLSIARSIAGERMLKNPRKPQPSQPTEARAISCSKSSMITEERLIECLGPNRLNLLQP